jgi:hypothetical protein
VIDPELELLILRGLVELKRIADALDRAYPEKVSPVRPPDDNAVTTVTPEMRARWDSEDRNRATVDQRRLEESLL